MAIVNGKAVTWGRNEAAAEMAARRSKRILIGMRRPTADEFVAYAHVQQYLRWHSPRAEDLTDGHGLIQNSASAVEFGAINDWNAYVEGYFLAARELLEGPRDQFFMLFVLYPVLFLYRHYLELELKGQMMDIGRQLNKTPPEFSTDHDVLSLWKKLKSMLPKTHDALRNAANIERVLRDIHLIDPKSLDTRYGLRKDLLTPSVLNPLKVDLDNLRDTMDRLHGELSILRTIVEYSK